MAKGAGFCYGVKRAVETTKKIKIDNPEKKVWVLGELIHNSQVIQELERMGIMTVNELPEKETGICIVRSHGMPAVQIREAEEKGFEVVDLTCLDVKKVQQKAVELAKDGYLVLILGKPEHPEVIAIEANAKMYSDSVIVIPNIEKLKEQEELLKSHGKTGIVIQTTQKAEFLNKVCEYVLPFSKELKIFNTICKSTSMRQDEAKKLALESDLMIVVGSKKSANTTHLAELVSLITKTIHIETKEDIQEYRHEILQAGNIGISAGASTPDYIINDVIKEIEKIEERT